MSSAENDGLTTEEFVIFVSGPKASFNPASVLDELGRKHFGRADLDAAARHALDRRLIVAVRREEGLDGVVVGSIRESDLEQRSTLELDARPQSAERKEDHARHDEQGRRR